MRFSDGTDVIEVEIGDIEHLTVICCHFWRTVHYRHAKFGNLRIRQGLHYDLVADAIHVSLGDPCNYRFFIHCKSGLRNSKEAVQGGKVN